jgi:CheY-like chemotaxis protein
MASNNLPDNDSRCLLLVEDEHQQRETLVMLFESEGYRVHATDSAETALELLSKTAPDLVVTDVKLIGMDGFTFFEKVRSGQAAEKIPFIFMTAYNDAGTIERVKQFGSVEYITKPFDLEDLLRIVRERSLPS